MLRWFAAALAALPLFAVATFHAAVAWWTYPVGLDAPPAAATFIQDRHGAPLAALAAADGQWRVPLNDDEISPHLRDAIVAVEDARFFEHGGVDWLSAAMAAWQDARGLRVRRGASTITMQLQRLRDPRPRTFFNKFEQAVRAAQLEHRAAKRELLTEYLNRAPFGGNLVGAGAASWRYFGRPCAQLSLGEAALLAGLPQSPNRLRPDRHPQAAVARRDHVLDRMLDRGFIDRHQYDEARAEAVTVAWRPLPQDRAAHALPAADGAMPLLANFARTRPGAVVRSTLDSAVQREAALAAVEHLHGLKASGVSAAAVVVLDTRSAECLAAVSLARGNGAQQVDLTRSPRSTGSVLKPLIYATAFEAGACGPQTVLNDSPAAWAGYEPADYDRRFRGPITAADALAESRNIPAMIVLSRVGVASAVGVMDAAGLKTLARSPGRYGLSLAIGGAEATPMEVAQAYAMLARGGVGRAVSYVRAEADEDADEQGTTAQGRGTSSGFVPHRGARASAGREVRWVASPAPRSMQRCLLERACWQTLNAISAPDRTAALCPAAARLNVAWKTGTSSGHRDAWCAAVTQRRTVVVWLGNAGGQASSALVGADAAAPLALRLIASLDRGAPTPWPNVSEDPARPVRGERSARTPEIGSLTLVSPAPGQQFVLDAATPADRQRVLLRASVWRDRAGGAPATLWWFVDGAPVAVGDAGAQQWWSPVVGTHEVRVVDALGHGSVAQVVVR